MRAQDLGGDKLMSKVQITRRRFAAGIGLLAASAGSAFAQSPPPKVVREPPPAGWPAKEIYPVWPGPAPGIDDFRPPVLAADWSAAFLRGVSTPAVNVFRAKRPNGRGVLVCPGGAYFSLSIGNEGVDIANALTPFGISVFVLTYRLPGEGWQSREDVPLQDAQRAMRLIRANAGKFSVDPEKLGVLGFSAGGHLAATLATDHAQGVYQALDDTDRQSARPAFAGLIYPLISLYASDFTKRMLLGDGPTAAQLVRRSPELHVAHNTPRCFLASAMDDSVVAPDHHAFIMLNALRQNRVPAEAHFFETGEHGFGVGKPGTPNAHWPAMFAEWLAI